MDTKYLKTGACSIVLGEFYYSKFVPIKKNKLVKITKKNKNHDESKYLNLIKEIKNNESYFAIPESEIYILKPTENFYIFLKNLDLDSKIFYEDIEYSYVNNAGDMDLLDSIGLIIKKKSIWKSYKDIINLINKICHGLNYLHEKHICHLDIKPENIMVNTFKKDFKIIDFGFSSIEPFEDFIKNTRGTPGYFPKYISSETPSKWLPKIEANDMVFKNGIIPIFNNRKLIYKIDSFCLGRVLYYLKYVYDENKTYFWYNNEKKKESFITNIISKLTMNNVYERYTIKQCIDVFQLNESILKFY